MMYLQFAGLLFCCAGITAGLVRCLHMLQQNSYRPERYLAFGKTVKKTRAAAALLSAAVMTGLYLIWSPGFACIALISAVVRLHYNRKEQKTAIKPLAVTARVKRQLTTALTLLAADCALWLCFPCLRLIFTAVALLFFGVTPLLALLVLFINMPMEACVSRHYIHDAKRILKQSPNMKIIGVTGSYGKTTTKFMIARLLQEKYTVTVTPESFNTPMGVVRTIREKMKPGTEIFVVEMGAKRVGDIQEICEFVHPDYGVITSIGPQHLDTFRCMDNIIRTKFELADAVAHKNGVMFLNYDSAPVRQRKPAHSLCYGTDPSLDAYAADITYHEGGASFTVCLGEEKIPLTTRLLGQHNLVNLTAAVAVARYFGVSAADIQYAVSTLKATAHRLEVKSFTGGSILIDDAYNANPAGCLEAVNVLGRFAHKKKIIVTPGLVELGEKEYQCNFDLGVSAGHTCDQIVLVGLNRSKPIADGVRSTGFPEENLHIVASFKDAMVLLHPTLDAGCAVLLENDLPDNYLY